jgi:hypothetical protein
MDSKSKSSGSQRFPDLSDAPALWRSAFKQKAHRLRDMAERYRCYPIGLAGSIDGPAHVFDCKDDASAIAKAHASFPERAFEVWQGARRVHATKARPIKG